MEANPAVKAAPFGRWTLHDKPPRIAPHLKRWTSAFQNPDRRLWARSRRNQDEEAVIPRLSIAMAGQYSEPAIFHWGRHRPLRPKSGFL